MSMKSKKALLLAMLAAICLLCFGCRSRTAGTGTVNTAVQEETAAGAVTDIAGSLPPQDAVQGVGNTGDRTTEDPNAARKEYDENAAAEIIAGTERSVHGEGEGEGAPLSDADTNNKAVQLNEQAGDAATQTVPADEAGQQGVSEDGKTADSAMTYYTVLLQDRMGSLFACQRPDLYWETADDHVTIYRTSAEHELILNAGLYDVSSRLLAENLRIEDGWVVRKDPGIIVKVVNGSVLGSGVSTADAAKKVLHELTIREDWQGISAVKNGRVILLSEELLQAPYLQTAAMVLIAKTAVPSQFSEVDADQMIEMLVQEATGSLPAGLMYYTEMK